MNQITRIANTAYNWAPITHPITDHTAWVAKPSKSTWVITFCNRTSGCKWAASYRIGTETYDFGFRFDSHAQAEFALRSTPRAIA